MPKGEDTAKDGRAATDGPNDPDAREPFLTRITNNGLRLLEDLIYALVALTLVGCAFVVLGDTVFDLVSKTDEGLKKAMKSALDSLLIVFILVELLSGVRTTISERKLVAEPFLLVGIIASIKEIVVVAAFAETKKDVAEAMLEVGTLGGIVLGLAFATWLLRRKEREPEE